MTVEKRTKALFIFKKTVHLQQLERCNILNYGYVKEVLLILSMKGIPNGCLSCQKRFITGY